MEKKGEGEAVVFKRTVAGTLFSVAFACTSTPPTKTDPPTGA